MSGFGAYGVLARRGVYPYLPLATNAPRTIWGLIKTLTNFSIQNSYNNCCQLSFLPLRIHQNRWCRLRLRPRPHWGAYSDPRPPSWFQGGRFATGGEWMEGLGERGREGRGGVGKGEEMGNLGNSVLVVGGIDAPERLWPKQTTALSHPFIFVLSRCLFI